MSSQVQSVKPLETSGVKPKALNKGGIWGKVLFYGVIGFFILNMIGLVGTVVVESFAQRWFGTWLPPAYTTRWYEYISNDHDMGQLLFNTLFVAFATTIISLLIGFPAAYVLARKQFRFKAVLTGLYLLPMMIPPLAYGIPLATLLIRWGLGGTLIGVIIINLVPVVPFVILILAPFIEQVDLSLESASRMLGANRFQTFMRVVLPLVIPGLLSAGMLAVVRTIAMFELTFLVADSRSQTLVVALYADAFAAGIRPSQAISAMAVVYMLTTMVLLIIALTFVKPTQFVVRIKTR
ncbi:MAG TPA: ABC transporter permease [Chloroflexia bacterium]|nr:ABC transporter permease [Chloroflexia bacterium]